MLQHDAKRRTRADVTWTASLLQIKREAFASQSCSRKGPDRDDDSMKMRRALEPALADEHGVTGTDRAARRNDEARRS
jgi:hypothetical protein